MVVKTVSDGLVDHVTLLKARPWFARLDVVPFATAYVVLFAALPMLDAQEHPQAFAATLTLLPAVLMLHLLLFLLSQSSVRLKSVVGNVAVADVASADLCMVHAAANVGKDRVVALHKAARRSTATVCVVVAGTAYQVPAVTFEFQKVPYRYDADKNTFVRLEYPNVAALADMLESAGHRSQEDVRWGLQKWGLNEFDIPIPSFLDLYLEHLVAPFFLFQVICLFLWSLDDYWYYSAFTLVMLMFFEGMLCNQRQGSLLMLRNMRRPPVEMYVLRCGTWAMTTSDTLVPGDVISMKASPPEPEVPPGRSRRRRRAADDDDDDDGRNGEFTLGPMADAAVVPCDAVIIRGSCVANEAMLTGESVPQLKESLAAADGGTEDKDGGDVVDLGTDSNINAAWRRHLVFSGTTLLQHALTARGDGDAAAGTSSAGRLASAKAAAAALPDPPDGGVVALVVRTAFGTTQGGLMRKILFATERVVSANSSETFYFIGVLVVFAVIASAVVLHYGLQDDSRNKFRLALHCIMILTSVVPPELPMELSLAVTNSLAALSRGLVFCTEPFRIPFAGKLDVLCFDKTGTLTKDKMVLKGVALAADTSTEAAGAATAASVEFDFSSLPPATRLVMGSCHSLLTVAATHDRSPGQPRASAVVGDPLEKATFEASEFQFAAIGKGGCGPDAIAVHCPVSGLAAKVTHRYPFSSSLKRMSTIAECHVPTAVGTAAGDLTTLSSGIYILTKGAPEVLEELALLSVVPPKYRTTYRFHMSRGKRVLALAYRKLSASEAAHTGVLPRGDVERGLIFAGFLLFDCDLKVDSKSVVRELRASDHRVVMITGDSAFTAADVAAKLGMTRGATKGLLILEDSASALVTGGGPTAKDGRGVVWRATSAEDDGEKPPAEVAFDGSAGALEALSREHALCVTGPALGALEAGGAASALQTLCPRVTIFARVSPAQKETILRALNDAGLCTLMCGDGTNDVGALKAAHVGVSIVNDPALESRIEDAQGDSADGATAASALTPSGKKAKGTSSKERVARAMLEMQAQEMDPTIVKLGDASIASPFTARRTSVDCVLTVLRQGRCTLVTTIQVFKVLALNCLVSAYMMSALYLRGLKQGDMQMTASGLITAGLFFFLSQAKPLPQIAAAKPPSSVFCPSVAISVAGQFAVHLACLVATLALCERYVTPEDPTMSADGKFQPNTVNSAVFMLSSVMQVNNFVVNYRGHPFTQSIQENTPLWRSVQAIYAALLIVAGGQVEPLNDFLQMAPFPSADFQAAIIGVLGANFALCYAIEKGCQRL